MLTKAEMVEESSPSNEKKLNNLFIVAANQTKPNQTSIDRYLWMDERITQTVRVIFFPLVRPTHSREPNSGVV